MRVWQVRVAGEPAFVPPRYVAPDAARIPGPPPSQFPPLPDKPSIAGYAVRQHGGDRERIFRHGMVEEIITALSRFKSLFVIAAQFELRLQGQGRRHQAGWARTRRALCARRQRPQGRSKGSDHRSVDRGGDRNHIWADRFDGDLADVFGFAGPGRDQRGGLIAPAWTGRDRAARRKPTRGSTVTILLRVRLAAPVSSLTDAQHFSKRRSSRIRSMRRSCLVLQTEHIRKITIERSAPDMIAGRRLDQLTGDPNLLTRPCGRCPSST